MEPLKDGMISWFDLDLDRRASGLYLKAKADKRVEDFIAKLGYGESQPLEVYSRLWVPPTGRALRIYNLTNDLDGRFRDKYSIGLPGAGLDVDGTINLSFLRLVGLSSEDGVSFKIELPMSRSRVGTMRAQLIDGVRELLQEYIVPVHVTMKLVSKPYEDSGSE